jgi:hypothetical protein
MSFTIPIVPILPISAFLVMQVGVLRKLLE